MTEVTLLNPEETTTLLAGVPKGKTESMLSKIADGLMSVLDSQASVFAVGLTESSINSLRTRMYRRQVRVLVRKTQRDGVVGHVLMAERIV